MFVIISHSMGKQTDLADVVKTDPTERILKKGKQGPVAAATSLNWSHG